MKTKVTFLLVFLAGCILGAAFEYAFLTYLWPNRYQSYTWIYTFRNHRKPGEPCQTDQVLDRQGYSLGYSYKYKAALWVSYVISKGSVSVDVGRHSSFYADTDIPEEYRTKPEGYLNTGYDKGHLAPSAAIDFSRTANRETFALSNVTLQEPKLNRQAWSRLEDLERDWTAAKGKLYVITGPIYTARPKKINDILLPAKFYKVVYAYNDSKAIGFILPNKEVSNEDLWQYAMSVAEVEKATELNFFSKFKDSTQKQLEETVDLAWWQAKNE